MIPPYLRKSTIAMLDHVLGIRSWGIILYGVLPAYFILLKPIKLDLTASDFGHYWQALGIIAVFVVPGIFAYLLILQKQRSIYLIENFARFRALVLTIMILVICSLLIGMIKVITGEYVLVAWQQLDWTTWLECGSLAMLSFLISSSLFLKVGENKDWPLLPKREIAETLLELKIHLNDLSELFKQVDSPSTDLIKKFDADCKEQITKLEVLANNSSHWGKALLDIVLKDLESAKTFIEKVQKRENYWNDIISKKNYQYFSSTDKEISNAITQLNSTGWR